MSILRKSVTRNEISSTLCYRAAYYVLLLCIIKQSTHSSIGNQYMSEASLNFIFSRQQVSRSDLMPS